MKNQKKLKKAISSQSVMIGTIITIISFFLILVFFVSNKDVVGSYAQDLQCRATIEAKSTATVNAGDEITKRVGIDSFFNVLNNKCPVDYISIKSTKKDEIFKKIADEEAKCYFRYGAGEKDFLSSFETSGSWCFVCGVVNVEESTEEYEYKNYIEWLSQTEYKKENGKSIKYTDYMKVKYTNINQEEIDTLRNELKSVLAEQDPALNGVTNVILAQYVTLEDLQLKKIDSKESIYVVYRYNRVDKSFEEQMATAGKGAMYSMGTAIVLGAVIESVPTGGIGFIKTIFTIPANMAKSFTKVVRLGEISKKMKNFIKVTGTGDKISDGFRYYSAGSKGAKFASFEKFNMNVKEMNELVKALEAAGKVEDLQKATNIKIIIKWMEEMQVDNFDDIAKAEKLNQEKLLKLRELFDKSVDIRVMSDRTLDVYAKTESKLVSDLGDYKALGDILEQEIKAGTFNPQVHGPMLSDYMKVTYIASAGAFGAYAGYNMNSKSEQYVDIMTKEQYFRLCGTERRIDERIKSLK